MSVQCVVGSLASLLSLSRSSMAVVTDSPGCAGLWFAVKITVWSGFVYLLRGFSLLRQG
ncbi:MAG: hypothetical protein U0936_00175 [Planctomycetaceae bacterium]